MKCTVVYPGQFVAWVTCMLKSYEDAIIAGMVKKGYVISVIATNGEVTSGSKDNPAVVVTIRVDSTKEETEAKDVHKDLLEVLTEKKFFYYSVIVSALADSCWVSSNIILPKQDKPIPPSIPEPDKSNLN
jgi:hypothetical protein